jgi:CubicO group peptidase (beta-lactamase class C family)
VSLQGLVEALERDPAQEPHGVVVLRDGAPLLLADWAPYAVDRPVLLYSLSKTFTAMAAGFAIAEDLVRLDDVVADFFPEVQDVIAPSSRGIIVENLLTMSTGHEQDMWAPAFEADPDHPVRAFLSQPPEHAPGSRFAYNQLATYTLATIIQRRAGGTLTDYLRPRLFDPLGIGSVSWDQQPAGIDLGFSGLHASTIDVAALGQLLLDGGTRGGHRVIDPSWVAAASARHAATHDVQTDPDWRLGYGYQLWMSRHGFRGDGAYGQLCLVLPEHRMVVAVTSQTADMQGLLDHVWRLLPRVDAPIAGPVETHRTLPGPAADPARITAARLSAAVGSYRSTAREPAAGLVGASVRADADGGWSVLLADASGAAIDARLGLDDWPAPSPSSNVSARAGRSVQGELGIDVVFTSTPHRLHMGFDPARGEVAFAWTTPPLHARGLRDLLGPGCIPIQRRI